MSGRDLILNPYKVDESADARFGKPTKLKGGSSNAPVMLYVSKFDLTNIKEDPNMVDDYRKSSLVDNSSDKPLFASEGRFNPHPMGMLDLYYNGHRGKETPWRPEEFTGFIGEDVYNPRGAADSPDFQKLVTQDKFRTRYHLFNNENYNNITSTVQNPVLQIRDKDKANKQLKKTYINFDRQLENVAKTSAVHGKHNSLLNQITTGEEPAEEFGPSSVASFKKSSSMARNEVVDTEFAVEKLGQNYASVGPTTNKALRNTVSHFTTDSIGPEARKLAHLVSNYTLAKKTTDFTSDVDSIALNNKKVEMVKYVKNIELKTSFKPQKEYMAEARKTTYMGGKQPTMGVTQHEVHQVNADIIRKNNHNRAKTDYTAIKTDMAFNVDNNNFTPMRNAHNVAASTTNSNSLMLTSHTDGGDSMTVFNWKQNYKKPSTKLPTFISGFSDERLESTYKSGTTYSTPDLIRKQTIEVNGNDNLGGVRLGAPLGSKKVRHLQVNEMF